MEATVRRAISQLLSRGLTIAELAAALGVSCAQVRSICMEPGTSHLRETPSYWYDALADMAWRVGDLESLARELESSKSYDWFLRMPVLHGPPQVLGLT